jgi:hypothetical protein
MWLVRSSIDWKGQEMVDSIAALAICFLLTLKKQRGL